MAIQKATEIYKKWSIEVQAMPRFSLDPKSDALNSYVAWGKAILVPEDDNSTPGNINFTDELGYSSPQEALKAGLIMARTLIDDPDLRRKIWGPR